jgi:hypothetical protein
LAAGGGGGAVEVEVEVHRSRCYRGEGCGTEVWGGGGFGEGLKSEISKWKLGLPTERENPLKFSGNLQAAKPSGGFELVIGSAAGQRNPMKFSNFKS